MWLSLVKITALSVGTNDKKKKANKKGNERRKELEKA